ncbi:MAG: manganese transport protein [Planctomycetota bacterium]|jgi:manganese transport protein
MSHDASEEQDLGRYQQGLRMANPRSEEELAAEAAYLTGLEDASWLKRNLGFLKLSGPGYMQSAMTLGGGTAASSLFAGAFFGYQLLWVGPVAMLLGIIMLSAVSHQTLSTGERPFESMRRFAGTPFAWAWAIGALLSSIVWHFPQYSLSSAFLVDLASVSGLGEVSQGWMGILVLVWAILLSVIYGKSAAMVRMYERILKYMVWGIVLSFGYVVVKTGISDWGALFRGFVAFDASGERGQVAAITLVISGLAAAVGVNMLFLYPYSLLARGWKREHRKLARFDLFAGMLLPYTLATSLMIIATANTLHLDPTLGTDLRPGQAAQTLAMSLGSGFGRIIFDIGIIAMALSSITLQMVTSGFVCTELFGWSVGSGKYRLATFLPVPGVLGAFYWSDIAIWVAVPTNILCGLFLPAAYIGFILLQKNRDYLGDDTPSGAKGKAWLGGMIFSTITLITFLGWYAFTKGPGYFDAIFGS